MKDEIQLNGAGAKPNRGETGMLAAMRHREQSSAPAWGWRIELLGELRAVSGESVVSRFRTQKTGFLLAYLALYLHRAHAREALLDRFWPEEAQEAGRHNLRNALSALRRQLGGDSWSVLGCRRTRYS